MTNHILNIDDIEYQNWEHGDRFEAKLGAVSSRIGAKKLGYNVTVLPPGKRAFPFHNHRVNEEMFFVLEGEGEIRIGTETYTVTRGDVIACPPGGPETAHQLINTSASDEMKYLAVATSESPEIAEYPDSDKVGVLAEFPAEDGGKPTVMRYIIRDQAGMTEYWEGE
jgi:uncharacterized cupin superfamily protein